MPEIDILANNIREIRKKANESQMEFAANCGIDMRTLSLIECGKSDPKLSTIQKIAAYADCTVPYLLSRKDE